MSGLSPEARSILDAARGGDEPCPADRKRIRSSLVAKLGAGVAAGTAATSAGSGVAAAGAKAAGTGLLAGFVPKGLIVLSAVGAIGVGAYAVRDPEPPTQPSSAVVVASTSKPEPAAPAEVAPAVTVEQDEAPSEAPEPKPAAGESPVVEPTTPSPKLAEEVESLREAHTALREGRADEAIEVLDRDAAPSELSGLDQEREAMRIFALCRLGEREKARQAAAAFLAKWPKSPLAARVASSCATP